MYYPDTVISSSKILKCYMVLLILKAELIIGTDIFIIQRGKMQRKKIKLLSKVQN